MWDNRTSFLNAGIGAMRFTVTAVLIGFLQLCVLAAAGLQLLGKFEFVSPAYSPYFLLGAFAVAAILKLVGRVWAAVHEAELHKANWPWIRIGIAIAGGGAMLIWQGAFSGGFTGASAMSWFLFQIGGLIVLTFAGGKLRRLATGDFPDPAPEEGVSPGAQAAIDAAIAARRSEHAVQPVPPTNSYGVRLAPRSFGRRVR
jgi:hypothetical protein